MGSYKIEIWKLFWIIMIILPCPIIFFYGNYIHKRALPTSNGFLLIILIVTFFIGLIFLFLCTLRNRVKVILIPITLIIQIFMGILGMVLSVFYTGLGPGI